MTGIFKYLINFKDFALFAAQIDVSKLAFLFQVEYVGAGKECIV